MIYFFRTEVGTFKITQNRIGRFELQINEVVIRSFPSPDDAADNVYLQSTGWDEWDELLSIDEPVELSEWSVGREFQ